MPAGKSWAVVPDPQWKVGQPHVHWSFQTGSHSRFTHSDAVTSRYALELEFGEEKEGRISGRIYVCLPDNKRSFVAGKFSAEIKGFRLIDGKPDLTSDSFKTLQVVAESWLASKHGAPVEITETDHSFMRHAGTRRPTGRKDVTYKTSAKADPETTRLQFAKVNGIWQVAAVLRLDQIADAHPLYAPDPKRTHDVIRYVAARWLEADLQKEHPGKPVRDVTVMTSGYSDAFAGCTLRYTLGDDKKGTHRKLVLAVRDGEWVVDREIETDARLDFKTGVIRSN